MKRLSINQQLKIVLGISFASAAIGILIGSQKSSTPVIQTSDKTEWATCFTPHQRCLGLIVKQIDLARNCILLQGYSFTSRPIAEALVRAHQRGVAVFIILDKSQKNDQRSQTMFLNQNQVSLRIDAKPAIAHNKVILIDHEITITGSYNWTKGAEERNAENLLVIKQRKLTEIYEENFKRRWNVSLPLQKASRKSRRV